MRACTSTCRSVHRIGAPHWGPAKISQSYVLRVRRAIPNRAKARICLEQERQRDELLLTMPQRDGHLEDVLSEYIDLDWLHRQNDRFLDLWSQEK